MKKTLFLFALIFPTMSLAAPITNTYSYQGQPIATGGVPRTITGSFTITSENFSNLLFNLADPSYCTPLNCSFSMTDSVSQTWNQSNIGASFFNVQFDAAGNIFEWFIHIGSGPFGLFMDKYLDTNNVLVQGDYIVDNGTTYPAPNQSNGIAGAWTLTSTTGTPGNVPEPAMLGLLLLGFFGIGIGRRLTQH